MPYQHIKTPTSGTPITIGQNGLVQTPDEPIITYIEGDGIGVDITPVMLDVVNAAVEKSYNGCKKIHWLEIYAGEKSTRLYGSDEWLPAETLTALQQYKVGIKGPLTTPIGGGIRSLNVALRQQLDLYVCQRPVRWFQGVPSPVREPNNVDMCIFRENSEDIYAGVEWEAGSKEAQQVVDFLTGTMGVQNIRFTSDVGIGIKTTSKQGTYRLVRAAVEYTIDQDLPTLTLVHKGNIMKFTEGAFAAWGYQLIRDEYAAQQIDGGPWLSFNNPKTGKEIIVNDVIADAFLQQILLRPKEYSVIACMNLNGDYISDALAAQVGGIGIAPGANIGNEVGLFEATHGTAPKYAGLDKVNPCSLILSAEMMLRHIGWHAAAQLVINAVETTISAKIVTYDFARLMDNATEVSTAAFGKAIINNMA